MKTKTFENGDLNSATRQRFQSKSEHLRMPNPRPQSFSSFSSVLVWTGENDVFDDMKTETSESALVWTGPNTCVRIDMKYVNLASEGI